MIIVQKHTVDLCMLPKTLEGFAPVLQNDARIQQCGLAVCLYVGMMSAERSKDQNVYDKICIDV